MIRQFLNRYLTRKTEPQASTDFAVEPLAWPWARVAPPLEQPPGFALEAHLASFEAWTAWCAATPEIFDTDLIESMTALIERQGLYLEGLGYAAPANIEIDRQNLRESVGAGGVTARARAVLRFMLEHRRSTGGDRVYVQEAFSSFARRVAALFPSAVFSEYAGDRAGQAGRNFYYVDVADAPFASQSFDIVVSNDVFEHVARLEDALREAQRVLKPGGVLLATFPFRLADQATETRAILDGGVIRHILPPEYHYDPLKPAEGALVFQVPGWDILDQCRAVGFAQVEMIALHSATEGILASGVSPIFVLRAQA